MVWTSAARLVFTDPAKIDKHYLDNSQLAVPHSLQARLPVGELEFRFAFGNFVGFSDAVDKLVVDAEFVPQLLIGVVLELLHVVFHAAPVHFALLAVGRQAVPATI